MRGAVWVTGATGFLGAHVVPALGARGHDVVALVRDPARAARLPALSGCRFHVGDVLEPASLRGAADGVESVVHLVGILRERGAATFESVVVEGTAAVLAEARRAGVRRVLYLSALGADPDGATAYYRSKGRAEELVRMSGLGWLILRASVVLGRGGDFLRLLTRLAGGLPVAPVPGHGRYPLQPVHVTDVAEAVGNALERPRAWNRALALCGPRAYELRELVRRAARGRRPLLVHVPWPLVVLAAWVGQRLLPSPPVTIDELVMLERGSTCDPGPLAEALGIVPRPVEGLLAGTEP